MDLSSLKSLGVTKQESQIYNTLLDKGSSKAGDVARITGIHRRNVYDCMERLIEKGLVGYIKKNNQRFYVAVNPQRLLEIYEEKVESVNKIMPLLRQKYKEEKSKETTLFFQGKQGLRFILDDQIKEGKEVLILGGSLKTKQILGYYIERYTNLRKAKRIPLKIIFESGMVPRMKIPLAKVRFLPKKMASPAATNIYADKVAIMVWSNNPIIVLIKNKAIADSYRKYFGLIWRISDD